MHGMQVENLAVCVTASILDLARTLTPTNGIQTSPAPVSVSYTHLTLPTILLV